MTKTLVPALATVCLLAAATPKSEDLSVVRSLPIRFERGQTDRTFVARGVDYQVAVAPTRCTFGVRGAGGEFRTISFAIAGAKPDAEPQVSGELSTKTSYFQSAKPSGWRESVSAYRKAGYNGLLPGVDIVYYGSGGLLEFDLIVHPGTDPEAIRMKYTGQESLSVDEDGNLVLELSGSRLLQKAPAVYQRLSDTSMRLVSGSYEVKSDGEVGYRIGRYDKSAPLVIDPAIAYSTYVAGTGGDSIAAFVRDKAGLFYIAGSTYSKDITATDSGAQLTSGGSVDGFLMKIDPNAAPESSVLYASYFGGTGSDEVRAMTIDDTGRILVAGVTGSTNFPTTQYSHQTTSGGETDGFLMIFDTTAWGSSSLLYSTYIGGAGADGATSVAAGPAGRVVVAGYTGSTNFPIRGNAIQASSGGGRDAFVADFDVFGTLSYSTYLGGDRTDSARAVAIDKTGAILVAGSTLSWGFPTAGGAADVNYHSGGDAFIAKIDVSLGTAGLVFSTFLGGSGLEEATGILLGQGNRVIVSGYTTSTDFPVTANAYQTAHRGGTDLFVTALDLSLPGSQSMVYSTFIGGSEGEVPYGMAFDPSGRVLLTGYTDSRDFPVTANAYQSTYGGSPADAFIVSLDLSASGRDSLQYSTYLGGENEDIGYCIQAGPDSKIYLAGMTSSRRFPANSQTARAMETATEDGFLIVIQP